MKYVYGRIQLTKQTIDASKTSSEIVESLAQHHATRIETLYEQGQCVGLQFAVRVGDQELGFRLPINVEATLETLKKHQREGRIQPRFVNMDQARRIAWRILKDWTEAQLAIIESGMVTTEEVFLPYLLDNNDRTLFEVMENRWKMLPEGREHD